MASNQNNNDGNSSSSSYPLLPWRTIFVTHYTRTGTVRLVQYQNPDQNATANLNTGITSYAPFPDADRHRDPLCDLPYLPGRQGLESQRLLYLFLLFAGPGYWGSTVQIYNHLFHRTSDLITYDGHLVTPAPPLPPLATELDLRRMLDEQYLYPTDREGVFRYMDETRQNGVSFLGQGRQRGMIYGLDDVLDMLRCWIADSGIQLVRDRGGDQSGDS